MGVELAVGSLIWADTQLLEAYVIKQIASTTVYILLHK